MSQPLVKPSVKTVKMQYHGPAHKLPRTFELPIPYLARSERVGSVETDAQGFCDMPEEFVEAAKEYCGMTVVGEKPTAAVREGETAIVYESKRDCQDAILKSGVQAEAKHQGFGRWKAIPATAQAAH